MSLLLNFISKEISQRTVVSETTSLVALGSPCPVNSPNYPHTNKESKRKKKSNHRTQTVREILSTHIKNTERNRQCNESHDRDDRTDHHRLGKGLAQGSFRKGSLKKQKEWKESIELSPERDNDETKGKLLRTAHSVRLIIHITRVC
jgi:hypothetical protein